MTQALDPGPFGDLPLLVTQPLLTILVASFLLGDNLGRFRIQPVKLSHIQARSSNDIFSWTCHVFFSDTTTIRPMNYSIAIWKELHSGRVVPSMPLPYACPMDHLTDLPRFHRNIRRLNLRPCNSFGKIFSFFFSATIFVLSSTTWFTNNLLKLKQIIIIIIHRLPRRRVVERRQRTQANAEVVRQGVHREDVHKHTGRERTNELALGS